MRGTLMEVAFNWLYREMTRGTKAQKVYSSHICPKYPKAAGRKLNERNTVNASVKCGRSTRLLFFGGMKTRISNPPAKARMDVHQST